MPVNVLFAASPSNWADYEVPLETALKQAGIDARLSATTDTPEDVDYLVYAPGGPVSDFRPFTRAKAVLCLWAGVETIVTNTTLTQPLARMVDTGLSEGMVEWVTGHVLRHHLGMDRHILARAGTWQPHTPPLARDRKVTVLGLGALGQACATTLRGLNFDVTGWSRRPRSIDGIRCESDDDGLKNALQDAEIVVLLLPNTPQTENTLNAETLALMCPGSFVINPGRGPLIEDEALLAALDSGHIAHATLDVFRVEPLPADHPYQTHPNVTVTPHIAAATRVESSCRVLVENIRRGEAGEPLLHLTDRQAGY